MDEILIDVTPEVFRFEMSITHVRLLYSGALALTFSAEGRSDVRMMSFFCDWMSYDGSELVASANDLWRKYEELGPPNSSGFQALMSISERLVCRTLLYERLKTVEFEASSNSLTLSMLSELFILLVPNMKFSGQTMMSIFSEERTIMDAVIAAPLDIRSSKSN